MSNDIEHHFSILKNLSGDSLTYFIQKQRGGRCITPNSFAFDRRLCKIENSNLYAQVYNNGKGKTCIQTFFKAADDNDLIGEDDSLTFGGSNTKKRNTRKQKT